MITPQTQIKINLPLTLWDFLAAKAGRYDVPIASYVKHLILNDVADLDYPCFQISEASEKKAIKALKQRKKSLKVDKVVEYFKTL